MHISGGYAIPPFFAFLFRRTGGEADFKKSKKTGSVIDISWTMLYNILRKQCHAVTKTVQNARAAADGRRG